jgi:DNA-directed RNA polymerase subunit RPC12/RpoP
MTASKAVRVVMKCVVCRTEILFRQAAVQTGHIDCPVCRARRRAYFVRETNIPDEEVVHDV